MGRMAGPFTELPISNHRVSPIGLIPKSVPSTFRLIHTLSYPELDSINDGIDKQLYIVQYTNFDDAIKLVVEAGKDALLAKADIKSAFRLLPIHPDDFYLLGFHNFHFVDKALPMVASCAPALFETFSTFLEWVVKMRQGLIACVTMQMIFCSSGRQIWWVSHVKNYCIASKMIR